MKLNSLDPQAYMLDVIDRMAKGHPISRLSELFPWVCEAARSEQALQAA